MARPTSTHSDVMARSKSTSARGICRALRPGSNCCAEWIDSPLAACACTSEGLTLDVVGQIKASVSKLANR